VGVQLYRMRGTLRGLQEYLQIYTGVTPQIIEHPANDCAWAERRARRGIALGKGNVPFSFTVNLCLPPLSAGWPAF